VTTLRAAVQAVLQGGPPGQAGGGDRITWETVQSVTGRQTCVILGRTLPVTGLATVVAGARVPVAWRDGQPVAFIAHRWRRAQFHPSIRVSVQGIVEELFVAALEGQPATVWYRNHAIVAQVTDASGTPIRAWLDGHAPLVVKWGLDGKSFAVQCAGGVYAVFALERADANVVADGAPWVATRLALLTPLASTAPLTTVTFTSETDYLDKVFTCQEEYVYTWHTEPGHEDFTLDEINGTFLPDVDGGGSSSGSTAYPFPLAALLAGTILDADGNAQVTAAVLDWFLDASRQLQFLLSVSWNYYRMGATDAGGTRTTYTNFAEDGTTRLPDLRAITSSFSGGIAGNFLGAKKVDLETVPESHVFLFNGSTGAVSWATAPAASALGFVTKVFTASRFQKVVDHRTYPDGGGEESTTWEWYEGAGSGGDLGNKAIDKGSFYQGTEPTGATNQQILDPASPLFPGPTVSVADTGMEASYSALVNRWHYQWDYAVGGKTYQRLWFYRVASAQLYSARAAAGVDEARLFLVIERYPFVGGTDYINDVPEIGVFLVRADGTLLTTLRAFASGLRASGSTLISANGHRALWTLGIGALGTGTQTLHTQLDTGAETLLTPAQIAALLAGPARFYPPDFAWDHTDPQTFAAVASLPTLVEDDALSTYGALLAVEGNPAGSVRIINDESLLSPVDRYQAT
jgi:hypothetical protein